MWERLVIMWKIKRSTDGEVVVLGISGRVEAWELAHLRETLASEGSHTNVAFDLRDLKLVDQASVSFLAHCEMAGATLRNCPAYIREWINREKAAK
jgi:ABC-type transporter Mla MlaB component